MPAFLQPRNLLKGVAGLERLNALDKLLERLVFGLVFSYLLVELLGPALGFMDYELHVRQTTSQLLAGVLGRELKLLVLQEEVSVQV